MKKRLKNEIDWIIFAFLFIGLIFLSLYLFTNVFEKLYGEITARAISIKPCIDSDAESGNKSYFIKGNISNHYKIGNSSFPNDPMSDFCYNSLYIKEFSCVNNRGNFEYKRCSSISPNSQCSSGACLCMRDSDCHNSVCRKQKCVGICGDGYVQLVNDDGIMEECDDGNNIDNDVCNNICKFSENLLHLSKISAGKAWSITKGSEDVVIAIIDTGIIWGQTDIWGPTELGSCNWNQNTVDFIPPNSECDKKFWRNKYETPNNNVDDDQNGYIDDIVGWDFSKSTTYNQGNDNNPLAKEGFLLASHGTFIAGIIGSNIKGICPNCKLMIIRIEIKSERASVTLTADELAKAIDYTTDNGANIISISWSENTPGSIYSQFPVNNSLKRAYNNGIFIVSSAGNDNSDIKNNFYPPLYNEVFAVGATDFEDKRYGDSNYGSKIMVSAPFRIINSAGREGTSFSAPMVAATVGLIKSVNPNLTNQQIKDILIMTADPINTDKPIGKRLNVYKAVLKAKELKQ